MVAADENGYMSPRMHGLNTSITRRVSNVIRHPLEMTNQAVYVSQLRKNTQDVLCLPGGQYTPPSRSLLGKFLIFQGSGYVSFGILMWFIPWLCVTLLLADAYQSQYGASILPAAVDTAIDFTLTPSAHC